MNYELARELKDAGFPQYGRGDYYQEPALAPELIRTGGVTSDVSVCCVYRDPNWRRVYVPTLTELIGACPTFTDNGNFLLICLGWKENCPNWLAGYEKYESYIPECWGETPEEAVAKLWLALNRK